MHPVQLKQARILIIDDEAASICGITKILHQLGYLNLQILSDPTQLRAEIDAWQPDLILLDLAMRVLNGFELLRMLRHDVPANESIPVLVISAAAAEADKRRALAGGATDFLAKPFDPSEMNMRIRSILESRFARLNAEQQNRELEDRVQERTAQLQTARAEIQAAQRRMLQQGRLSAFAEMAGGVVHDFSNTLMAVIGYSEMLLSGEGKLFEDKKKALHCVRIINGAGRDAAEAVTRLRDFYRPHDDADLFVPVDLQAVAEQAILLTRPKWKDPSRPGASRISVVTDFAAVPLINGNAGELRSMLTNLIFNAVDAMPDGGTLTIRTRFATRCATLEVADTGEGMTPEVRACCFDPFFSTKSEAGAGLGLAMVSGTVKRHQGAVEIETEDRRGTTFKILLHPLITATAPHFLPLLN